MSVFAGFAMLTLLYLCSEKPLVDAPRKLVAFLGLVLWIYIACDFILS